MPFIFPLPLERGLPARPSWAMPSLVVKWMWDRRHDWLLRGTVRFCSVSFVKNSTWIVMVLPLQLFRTNSSESYSYVSYLLTVVFDLAKVCSTSDLSSYEPFWKCIPTLKLLLGKGMSRIHLVRKMKRVGQRIPLVCYPQVANAVIGNSEPDFGSPFFHSPLS